MESIVETEVRHGGYRYWDSGLTAVIEVEGSTRDLPNLLVLNTKRTTPLSIHQLGQRGRVSGAREDPRRQGHDCSAGGV